MKLPVRVRPESLESLSGYLMRVAARNGLKGPGAILRGLTGSPTKRLGRAHVLALAELTRCNVPEIFQLTGINRRRLGDEFVWNIGRATISKSYLIRTRQLPFCPRCLEQKPYLRGEWEITFYVACHVHRIKLLSQCPVCKRPAWWLRELPERCSCGFHLGASASTKAGDAELLAACLISHGASQSSGWLPTLESVSAPVAERLAGLSLDALLKTIWLMGHILHDFASLTSGQGRRVPDLEEAGIFVRRCADSLHSWPIPFQGALGRAFDAAPSSAASQRSAIALHRFLSAELEAEEFSFIRAAYQSSVAGLWADRRPPTSKRGPTQLALGLEL